MPRWTKENLYAYELKRATANRDAGPSVAEPQPVVRHEPLGEASVEAQDTGRISVRIESRRRRLLDTDNASPKIIVDCLRYAKLIPDDRPQDIELTVTQTKVATKAEECTVIQLTPL